MLIWSRGSVGRSAGGGRSVNFHRSPFPSESKIRFYSDFIIFGRFDDSALYSSTPNEEEEIEDMANFTRDKLKEIIESRLKKFCSLKVFFRSKGSKFE